MLMLSWLVLWNATLSSPSNFNKGQLSLLYFTKGHSYFLKKLQNLLIQINVPRSSSPNPKLWARSSPYRFCPLRKRKVACSRLPRSKFGNSWWFSWSSLCPLAEPRCYSCPSPIFYFMEKFKLISIKEYNNVWEHPMNVIKANTIKTKSFWAMR